MAEQQRPATVQEFAESIPAYLADVCLFAEDVLRVKDPRTGQLAPLELDDHQRAALQEATRFDEQTGRPAHKTVVFSWPKREGKTLLVGIIVLWRLFCWRGQRIVILANSERQAASVLFEQHVCERITASPVLKRLCPDTAMERKRLVVASLGNELQCVPCNPNTVQGMAVTLLACDELHAADKPRAYYMLSAQTEAADAQICISSQAGPPVDENPMWRLYQGRGTAGISFNYSQQHLTPWGKRLADDDRVKVPPAEWRYMHLNEWAGQGQKLFLAEDIEAAAMDYRMPRSREEWLALKATWGWERAPGVIGVGLDRAGVGRAGDRTVWSVVARFDLRSLIGRGDVTETTWDVYRVVMLEVLPTGSEAEILEVGRRSREIFGRPDGAMFEMYGCADLVEKFSVDSASLEAPTTARQRKLFNRMWRLFAERRIGFPADAGTDPRGRGSGLLKYELIEFEHQCPNGENTTRYGTQSGHDDTVYALAWSAEAIDGSTRRRMDAGSFAVSDWRRVYRTVVG